MSLLNNHGLFAIDVYVLSINKSSLPYLSELKLLKVKKYRKDYSTSVKQTA